MYDSLGQDGERLSEEVVDGGGVEEEGERAEMDLEGRRELAASLAAVAEGIGGLGLDSGLLDVSEAVHMDSVQVRMRCTSGGGVLVGLCVVCCVMC